MQLPESIRNANSASRKMALQLFGMATIIVINIFLFGSDSFMNKFKSFSGAEKAFYHASHDHQINRSPFSIPLKFDFKAAPPYDFSTDLPVNTLPPGYALVAVCFLFITLSGFSSRLILGERKRNDLAFLFVIIPPPKPVF